MRILMLSWRAVGHPQAGGAEVVTHEVLRRLVRRGHEATLFTAEHDGAPREDVLDGVRIVRAGRQWTVHLQAARWVRRHAAAYEVVVDQVNTIPFLTPLYVRDRPRLLFIHQLARGYWFRETRGVFRLVAPFGYAAEPIYLRAYRTTPALTVSRSTADDLQKLGIGRRGLAIMPQALPFSPLDRLETKPDGPARVIVLGRLTPAKHVEEAVEAFLRFRCGTAARLDVVGAGDPAYRRRLERLVATAGATEDVVFHGNVDEDRKLDLLRHAHVHLFCSHREGWGLTVTEAAAMGTPSLGYDVPGVRDSIGDPVSLSPAGDVGALAASLAQLTGDAVEYERRRRDAWERARRLSYDRTTDVVEATLSDVRAGNALSAEAPRR